MKKIFSGLFAPFRGASRRLRIRFIGLFLLLIVVTAGSGVLIYQIVVYRGGGPKPPELTEEELALIEAAKPKPEFTFQYEIRNVSIPLVDKAATRVAYAQFTLVLDCQDESVKRVMELNRAKLLDLIFEVASQFYVEDFRAPNGLDRFKDALLAAYEGHFKNQSPRSVALKNWLVG